MIDTERKRIVESQIPDRRRAQELLTELVKILPPHVRVSIVIETLDISGFLDRKPSTARGPLKMETEVRTSFPNDPDPSWESVEWQMNTGPLYPTRVKIDERA